MGARRKREILLPKLLLSSTTHQCPQDIYQISEEASGRHRIQSFFTLLTLLKRNSISEICILCETWNCKVHECFPHWHFMHFNSSLFFYPSLYVRPRRNIVFLLFYYGVNGLTNHYQHSPSVLHDG